MFAQLDGKQYPIVENEDHKWVQGAMRVAIVFTSLLNVSRNVVLEWANSCIVRRVEAMFAVWNSNQYTK